MQLVIVLIAVIVIGLAALVAAGWFGAQQAEPVRDVYEPPGDMVELTSADLEKIRFGLAPMGYDMAQVDRWMARLARELELRDEVEEAPGPDTPDFVEFRYSPAAELPAERELTDEPVAELVDEPAPRRALGAALRGLRRDNPQNAE